MLISNHALSSVELLRNYNWDIVLPDVTPDSNSQSPGVAVLGSTISPFVQAVSFGQYTMDDLNPVRHGALQSHSAGVFSISTVSMDFLCDNSSNVFQYFETWRGLIFDENNLFYYPKFHYVNGGTSSTNPSCLVSFYDTVGNMSNQYLLVNIFPKTFPNFKLDYEQQSVLKFTVEFSVDNVIPSSTSGI